MDKRPANCRFRLQDEGKPYPRSSCTACGKSVATGLGSHCTHAEPVSIATMEEIHVIWWRYSDGSAAGVLRAYADRQRADEDMDLLESEQSGKTYTIETLPIYHESRKP